MRDPDLFYFQTLLLCLDHDLGINKIPLGVDRDGFQRGPPEKLKGTIYVLQFQSEQKAYQKIVSFREPKPVFRILSILSIAHDHIVSVNQGQSIVQIIHVELIISIRIEDQIPPRRVKTRPEGVPITLALIVMNRLHVSAILSAEFIYNLFCSIGAAVVHNDDFIIFEISAQDP